jgi:hypothetical protein
MSQPASGNPNVIPPWLVAVGSAVIVAHLLAVGAQVLAAPSGPWLTRFGPSPAEPPTFAQLVNDVTGPYYLWPLRLNHHYRFASNQVDQPGVEFTVRLKDKDGRVFKTLTFPDKDANFWVRHRQSLLAQALGNDQPVQRGGPVALPGVGQKAETVRIWDGEPGQMQASAEKPFKLTTKLRHELVQIPRDEIWRPSDWSLLLARSYVRHLCREHGAASGELVRHSKVALPPAVLLPPTAPPAGMFANEFFATFGDLPRE